MSSSFLFMIKQSKLPKENEKKWRRNGKDKITLTAQKGKHKNRELESDGKKSLGQT